MQQNTVFSGEYSRRDIFLVMALVYIFGVICRLYWVVWASGMDEFWLNGVPLLTTNDAFANAEGARDMLAGFHQKGDLSPYGASIPTLTFLISNILSSNVDTVAFYSSIFLSPLLAVPVILISREYKMLSVGVVASLLVVSAPGYYIRTMGGYFDSDMLNITLPALTVWSLIKLVKSRSNKDIFLPAVFTALYSWWYVSSYSLNLSLLVTFLLYTLAADRRNDVNYKAAILMAVALIRFDYGSEGEMIVNYVLALKVVLIAALYFFMAKASASLGKKAVIGAGLFVAILFVSFGGFEPVLYVLDVYINKNVGQTLETLYFYSTRKTVIEVANISFNTFAIYATGNVITFIVSMAGLVLLVIKFRSFILALPMAALGFLSFVGGVRFAMYITPVTALGFAYFVYFTFEYFGIRRWLKNAMTVLLACLALTPNIDFIYRFLVPPTLFKSSIAPLVQLKDKASREDYVVSWWDFGYLIRYYADVKVVSDPGSRQIGEYAFLSAFMLNENQTASANMARLSVEYIEQSLDEKPGSLLLRAEKDYGEKDINKFLKSLNDENFKLPKKTRDVYYYFVPEIIDMLPAILKFTSINIATGEERLDRTVHIGYQFTIEADGKLDLGGGWTLPGIDSPHLLHNGKEVKINSRHHIARGADGNLVKNDKKLDESADIHVLFLADYERILILDQKAYDSAFVQMFLLDNHDKNLFEQVYLGNKAKIYKLLK